MKSTYLGSSGLIHALAGGKGDQTLALLAGSARALAGGALARPEVAALDSMAGASGFTVASISSGYHQIGRAHV